MRKFSEYERAEGLLNEAVGIVMEKNDINDNTYLVDKQRIIKRWQLPIKSCLISPT